MKYLSRGNGKIWRLRTAYGVALVVVTGLLTSFVPSLHTNALHNAAWVNDHVEWQKPSDGSAKPQVVSWENDCTATFNSNVSSMPHSNDYEKRQVVNASAYYQDVWLSRRGDAKNINNPPVTPGQSVDMQINDLVFLCAIVTMNPTGFAIHTDHKVTTTNYPNDRAPVPDNSSGINQASRYESNSKIYNVAVTKGPGTVTNEPVGKILGYKRDNDSRYWSAPPVNFTYKVPTGLAPGTYKVTIEFEYATIQTYHDYGADGTSRCTLKSSGDGANVPYNRFDLCEHRTETYPFTFTIKPPGKLSPSSTVDKPKMGYPDTATFTHYVNASSFSSGSYNVNYLIQRYRNGVPTGAPQIGNIGYNGNGQFPITIAGVQTNKFTSADTDAGAHICERLTLFNPSDPTAVVTGNPSEACTVIVKRPYLTVTNNDVWAGSRFDYANNRCAGAPPRLSGISSWVSGTAGAVGEYGVMALGPIVDFGSGKNPAGSGLTFANAPALGSLGAPTHCLANYYDTINANGQASQPWPGIGGIPANAGKLKYFANGPLTISTGTIPKGTQVVLLVNGTVRITGKIDYANSYGSANDISSLWIVAQGDINIQENVMSINGFFVAEGTAATPGKIQTCVQTGSDTTYNPLHAGVCDTSLDVYGAFIADKIYWQRTHGSAAPGQPYAESVQFDTGLYLTTPLTSSGTGSATIQDTKELPPIY